MPLIELTTVIRAPIARCFDLARSIDLHKLSTQGTDEEAVGGVTSGLIGKGQRVTWRARHFGVTHTLTSEITEFCSPYHFCDEMVRGPFSAIRHDHLFERTLDGTLMIDKFWFRSPAWILGIAFNKLVLERYLRSLLARRNQVIKEFAESEKWKLILQINRYETTSSGRYY